MQESGKQDTSCDTYLRPTVAPKHNDPQVKPVVFESRTPCAADRSGFAAKPAGPPPGIHKA